MRIRIEEWSDRAILLSRTDCDLNEALLRFPKYARAGYQRIIESSPQASLRIDLGGGHVRVSRIRDAMPASDRHADDGNQRPTAAIRRADEQDDNDSQSRWVVPITHASTTAKTLEHPSPSVGHHSDKSESPVSVPAGSGSVNVVDVRTTDFQKSPCRVDDDKVQQSAVGAPWQSRLLVTGGPGTGKTEVVARRVVDLVQNQGLKPTQVLVLCFARSAVEAVTRRIRELGQKTGAGESSHVSVRTFDAWSYKMMQFCGFSAQELLSKGYDGLIAFAVEQLRARNERLMGKLIPIRHILVDEYQDLSGIRAMFVLELLGLLASRGTDDWGFTLLGDPCQAIYDWALEGQRGRRATPVLSSMDLVVQLKGRYGHEMGTVVLPRNHRFGAEMGELVDEARFIVEQGSKNGDARGHIWKLLARRCGAVTTVGDLAAVIHEVPRDRSAAVLCRANAQVALLENELRQVLAPEDRDRLEIRSVRSPRSLPLWVGQLLGEVSGNALSRRRFGLLWTFVERYAPSLSQHLTPEEAWRILQRVSGGVADADDLNLASLRDALVTPDVLSSEALHTNGNRILLTTIHQSKGLEFDDVFLADPGDPPTGISASSDEEARVLFVALSRARQRLVLADRDLLGSGYRQSGQRFYRDAKRGAEWNMEIGRPEDIDHLSMVDEGVCGETAGGETVQHLLSRLAPEVPGTPVELRRVTTTLVEDGEKVNRYFYDIVMKFKDEGEVTVGRTSSDFAILLWRLCHGHPTTIKGLRARGVATWVANSRESLLVASPWKESRIWLYTPIYGMGRFVLP
jgi:hypothetical protein